MWPISHVATAAGGPYRAPKTARTTRNEDSVAARMPAADTPTAESSPRSKNGAAGSLGGCLIDPGAAGSEKKATEAPRSILGRGRTGQMGSARDVPSS